MSNDIIRSNTSNVNGTNGNNRRRRHLPSISSALGDEMLFNVERRTVSGTPPKVVFRHRHISESPRYSVTMNSNANVQQNNGQQYYGNTGRPNRPIKIVQIVQQEGQQYRYGQFETFKQQQQQQKNEQPSHPRREASASYRGTNGTYFTDGRRNRGRPRAFTLQQPPPLCCISGCSNLSQNRTRNSIRCHYQIQVKESE